MWVESGAINLKDWSSPKAIPGSWGLGFGLKVMGSMTSLRQRSPCNNHLLSLSACRGFWKFDICFEALLLVLVLVLVVVLVLVLAPLLVVVVAAAAAVAAGVVVGSSGMKSRRMGAAAWVVL